MYPYLQEVLLYIIAVFVLFLKLIKVIKTALIMYFILLIDKEFMLLY